MGRVIGPGLLANYNKMKPSSFTVQELKRLHGRVERGVASTFEQVGGPALRPVVVEFLDQESFEAAFKEHHDAEQLTAVSLENCDAFALGMLENGAYKSSIFYSVNGLQGGEAEGRPAGSVIVHECVATIYAAWMEQFYVSRGISTYNDGMINAAILPEIIELHRAVSMIGDAWAGYLSSTPFAPEKLLMLEVAFTTSRQVVIDAGMRGDIEEIMTDVHAFGALALLKIEMAFGFDRLVPLMNSPLIIFAEESGQTGVKSGEIVQRFWAFYDRANRQLGVPSIPFEECSALAARFPDPVIS